MADLFQFVRRFRLRANAVPKNANLLLRKVALIADQAVVTGTPVSTGTARSNWLVSVSQPRSDTIPPYSPGENQGIGESANANAAIAQGAAVIGSVSGGQSIIIANNIPYIGKLNAGSSQQAPANFVELAILEASRAVGNVRIAEFR